MYKATNEAAKAFKALHIPGKPLLLANIYDVTSARFVASLPECKALATASYAIAKVNGLEDPQLDLKTHIKDIREIAAVAREAQKPLTVDLQEGYGDQLEEAVKAMIDLGVVGINLEDSLRDATMMNETTAIERIERALAIAKDVGVPDFVVNARSDSYLKANNLDESIRRGKLYLEAGATCVFIIGPNMQGSTREEVTKMVEGLDGRVNIAMRITKPGQEEGVLAATDLAQIGISRVSVGPQLWLAAAEAIKGAATRVYSL
jgi:2-methylisocitrate lyase-like PEP mutase family enzyme